MKPLAATTCALVLLGGCHAGKSAKAINSNSVNAKAAKPAKLNSLPPVMQRQVLNAVDAGEGNPHIRELRQRMAAQPENIKVRLELAAEYGRLGFPELELEHLRLATERFPDSEAALIQLGRVLIRSGQTPEAISRLTAFVAKEAKPSANLLSWAGIALDEAQRRPEAEHYHRRAVDRAPARDALHNNLGYNLLMQGRRSEAAECFRKALELNPESDTARNNLGLALAGQPSAALAQLRQTSDLGIAHNNLAAYFYEQGDMEAARKQLELALQYRRDVPKILENMRRVAAADGKPIVLTARTSKPFWKTIARGLKRTFLSGEEKSYPAQIESAR